MIVTDPRARVVLERISQETGVAIDSIVADVRTRSVCIARGKVAAALWLEHGMSFTEVGAALGRNHTGLLVAVRKALGPDLYKCELAKRGRKVA